MRIDKAFCDNCGEEDLHKCFPVQLSCGFGSIFDDMNFDFCSDKCCVEFIQSKQKECESGKGYTLPLRERYLKKLDEMEMKK